MYQQIPLPLSAFLLSTALPAVFLSAALSPYGYPPGASRPIRAAFVPGLSYSSPSERFPWYLYRYIFIRVQHGSVGDFR